jgi:hypothetical protein
MWFVIATALAAVLSAAADYVVQERRATAQLLDCSLSRSIHQLARNMNMRIGFENLPGCPPGPQERGRTDAMPPIAVSPVDALDRLLATAPEFAWRTTDGVYVVRPATAWRDATDPLNFPTTPFRVDDIDVDSGLRILVQHVSPSVYIPFTVERRPAGSITREFRGGTFLDALDAMIAAGSLQTWEVSWIGTGVVVVESNGLGGLSASAPLRHP